MRKRIFTLVFVLINGSFLFAQTMLPKKITVTTTSNFKLYDYYKYNVDWKLDSIIEVNQIGDTTRLFLFDNDSLKAEIQSANIWTFFYYGSDSIVELYSSQPNGWNTYQSGVYYLNSEFEMTSYKVLDTEGNNLWTYYYTYEDGNCIEISIPGVSSETMDYSSYINPHLNERKYFRRAYMGSVNYLEHGDFTNSQIDFDVISSLNNYPEKVNYYADNELFSTIEYEYYDFFDVDEILTNEMPEILEVHYYNLIGQEIEKPLKGFYIERITTDKGIISSKKHTL
jgi:hypothetical protein